MSFMFFDAEMDGPFKPQTPGKYPKENILQNKVCSTIFLDVAQAFDKVRHEGLNHKLELLLPVQYSRILESYISERYFRIKQEDAYSDLRKIQADV